MTKLGLIADIHADVEALQQAIDLLRDQGVDGILCAGDLVEKGMYDDEAVELIKTEGIPCVRGNHDDHAVRTQDSLRNGSRFARLSLTRRLLLKDETLDFLKQLPKTLAVGWEEWRILVAHGTPWNDSIYLYRSSHRYLFEQTVEVAQADLVVVGHTHSPLMVKCNHTWIVNPGAICGTYASGSRTCGVFSLDDASFEVFKIDTGKPVEVASVEFESS
ncbi:MAG: metallophosphoesterase family protein [Anaerolineae bacterium]|nr:metallophosphoesterase family protein [Anaerolineae bacterium]